MNVCMSECTCMYARVCMFACVRARAYVCILDVAGDSKLKFNDACIFFVTKAINYSN